MRRPSTRKPGSKTLSSARVDHGLVAGALLLFFFLYVWLRIPPAVEYQHSGPVFLLTRSFLSSFLNYAGGPLGYVAAFISQGNYYNWLGALVYTLLAGLLFLGGRVWLGYRSSFGRLTVPCILLSLLLLLREQFDGTALPVCHGLCAAVGGAVVHSGLRRVRNRLFSCWAIAILLFYLAGLWVSLLFLILVAIFESSQTNLKFLSLLLAPPVLAGGLWWLKSFADVVPILHLDPGCKGVLSWLALSALYLVLPVAGVLSALRGSPVEVEASEPVRGGARAANRGTGDAAPIATAVLAAAGFITACLVVWFGMAEPRRRLAEIDYCAACGNYEGVLHAAASLRRDQLDVASEVRLHRALYHTRRLGEEAFSYRNQSGWEVLPGLVGGLDSCRAQSRTMLELGLVSEAEHLAHEALETEGERPELLCLLAEVNLLKQRPQAAQVFLSVLNQVPFQQAQARSWLRNLKNDPQCLTNLELAAVRPLLLTNDLAHQSFPPEGLLVQLLRCNPTNRMAFEYLMAHYLMKLEVDKVVDRLWQLEAFKYQGIPRHYEEALLLYEQARGTHLELAGRKVRPETVERFRRFTDAMNQRQFTSPEGRRAMVEIFGDTYWYYYFARRNETRRS